MIIQMGLCSELRFAVFNMVQSPRLMHTVFRLHSNQALNEPLEFLHLNMQEFQETSVQKYFQLGCFINYQMYIVFAAVNSLFCFSCFVIKNFDLLRMLSASKPASAELYQEVFAGEHLTLINHLPISL